ncbi:MAG: hypothetical protein ACRD1W_05270 [Vicinamibacterales bacterium]
MRTTQCNILAMRVLFIGAVMAMLGHSAPLYAQNTGVSPLARFIDTDFRFRSTTTDCTVASAVLGLARRYHFLAGIEYLRAECATPGERGSDSDLLNLRGMTVGDALKKLTALDPRYRWIESDGVIIVRPLAAWSNPKNVLNYQTESFVLKDATLGNALNAIVSAITGTPREHPFSETTEQGARRFNVTMRTTSAGEALDAIVRAHGASYWVMREGQPGREGPIIWLHTFDGMGIGSGVIFPK